MTTSFPPRGFKESLDYRKEELEETDYFALSDVTMTAEMATYRQALRDITQHYLWPYVPEDEWPTKP